MVDKTWKDLLNDLEKILLQVFCSYVQRFGTEVRLTTAAEKQRRRRSLAFLSAPPLWRGHSQPAAAPSCAPALAADRSEGGHPPPWP
mmetsp:Transcript_45987/g.98269  ORF Transcript_45987/g.98269 Transcript_45987/m.98269 type:complete len:87 (-) Transcript_45987:224-484(-)